MANGYNPYSIAESQQGLLEGLLGAEQAQKLGQIATGQKKGEMSEEFQKELIAAQKEQERLLQEKRRGKRFLGIKWGEGRGLLEKIAPLLGITGIGGIAGGVLGGLAGMYKTARQRKFAGQQREAARGVSTLFGDKWGGTFLGGQAREATSKTDTLLDRLRESSRISDMGIFTKGLTSGISGYALGKMGENVAEAFAKPGKLEGLDLLKPPTDVFGPINAPGSSGFFKKLMGGLSQDPSTLLAAGGDKENVAKSLMLLLSQLGLGDE